MAVVVAGEAGAIEPIVLPGHFDSAESAQQFASDAIGAVGKVLEK